MAGIDWNGWPESIGISGRNGAESAGGAATGLTKEFQAQLLAETNRLVEAVKQYPSGSEYYDAVRDLKADQAEIDSDVLECVLQFPVLHPEEVELILGSPASLDLAARLVNGRLPSIKPKTLVENTRDFR